MTCPETICCSTQLLYNLQIATMTQLEFLQNEFNLGIQNLCLFYKRNSENDDARYQNYVLMFW